MIRRVPIPKTTTARGAPYHELFEALQKAVAAGEAVHLDTAPTPNARAFRSTVSQFALRHGYRAHVQRQPDHTWILWLEPAR